MKFYSLNLVCHITFQAILTFYHNNYILHNYIKQNKLQKKKLAEIQLFVNLESEGAYVLYINIIS